MVVIPHTKTTGGFTLLEVMVVIVILGVLASLVVPPAGQQRKPIGKKPSAISWRWRMRWICTDWITGVIRPPGWGLEALIQQPANMADARNRTGGYIKRLPDPWGNDYRYLSPGEKGCLMFMQEQMVRKTGRALAQISVTGICRSFSNQCLNAVTLEIMLVIFLIGLASAGVVRTFATASEPPAKKRRRIF